MPFRLLTVLSFLLISVLGLGCGHATIAGPSTLAITPHLSNVERNQRATVSVVYLFKTDDGNQMRLQTSGVAVSPYHILTSLPPYVTARQTDNISIYALHGEERRVERFSEVESILINEANLFVLMKIKKPMTRWVLFSEPKIPTAGDRLYSVDLYNYAGQAMLLGALHAGIVSHSTKDQKEPVHPFLAEIEITVTSTGCGVYDPDGNFIGLLVNPLFRKDADTGTGAIVAPANEIAPFLDANNIPYQSAPK